MSSRRSKKVAMPTKARKAASQEIAIKIGYLAWSSKRVSHLITNPSTMISIINQIQASITGEAK
jgi:hypothetical protein